MQAARGLLRPLLRPLQLFLRSADARDKCGRLVQYALRLLLGLCAALPVARAPAALVARLRSLMETISDARRTHRWLKGISPLLALRASARAPAWPIAIMPGARRRSAACDQHFGNPTLRYSNH